MFRGMKRAVSRGGNDARYPGEMLFGLLPGEAQEVLGPENNPDPTFSNPGLWVLPADVTLSNNQMVMDCQSDNQEIRCNNGLFTAGSVLKMTGTVSDYLEGHFYILDPVSVNSVQVAGDGEFTLYIRAAFTRSRIRLFCKDNAKMKLDALSWKNVLSPVITAGSAPTLTMDTGVLTAAGGQLDLYLATELAGADLVIVGADGLAVLRDQTLPAGLSAVPAPVGVGAFRGVLAVNRTLTSEEIAQLAAYYGVAEV